MQRNKSILVTVLTPVYNRKKELNNLFNSLKNQNDKNFKWLIVDDGSIDGVDEIVETWINDVDFSINYIKQQNGGKHRALNNGIKLIDTVYTFIVDSDDILTFDAISTINKDAERLKNESEICGIGYLRGYSDNEVIGDKYPNNDFIGDFIEVRFNKNVRGDKAEVWKTEDLLAVPFPEIPGEKFMGEGYVWCSLAENKQMYFVNKIIYITEYLSGGLSDSGRSLRIKCPIGGMYSSKLMMNKKFNLKNRIKGVLLYIAYGKFAGYNMCELIKDSNHANMVFLFYIPGVIIYFYWKKKYQ